MHTKFFASSLAIATLIASPAYCGSDYYGLGQNITYDNLVDKPDIVITYVAYDQKGVATLMLGRNDGSAWSGRPQVELRKGESHDIFIKNECGGGPNFTPYVCRLYVVTLTWDGTVGNDKIRLNFEVKIRRGSTS
jgi:hypothetical protein